MERFVKISDIMGTPLQQKVHMKEMAKLMQKTKFFLGWMFVTKRQVGQGGKKKRKLEEEFVEVDIPLMEEIKNALIQKVGCKIEAQLERDPENPFLRAMSSLFTLMDEGMC